MRVTSFFSLPWVALLPCMASAQLIPPGQAVPKGANPPVVFVNGYQLDCGGSNFASTFGTYDAVLQANQIVTLFFDNCTVPNKPSIEALGAALGQFLAGLKYTDGTPVPLVDVVAHSMGGLIVRSYLSGKQDATPAAFNPPPNPGIRKMVFLATPHFGTGIASSFGFDTQTKELGVGSQFLFDLNTWNNGSDDLRGLDALAVAGNGGTGTESTIPGFDDGVVTLTSASIGFAEPGRTRVLPVCHISSALVTLAGLCPSSAPAIASVTGPNSASAPIVVSFLTGTPAWQTLGQAIEANSVASTLGGINIEAEDSIGAVQPINHASVTTPGGTVNLQVNSGQIAYTEGIAPNVNSPTQIQLLGTVQLSPTVKLPATTVLPFIAKNGPVISRAIPAAAATFPLNVAPREFVAIYGSNLASTTQTASTAPFPTQLGGTQVMVNGVAVPVQYVSSGQINFLYPANATGLTKLTVQNASGQQTINVFVQPTVPAIFSLDGSGSGAAAALNGLTGVVVGSGAPLHAGDYLELFLTGLGQTATSNGYDLAVAMPTVSVGGQQCAVTYAGAAPTLQGVDQINCRIPSGVTGAAAPVVVTTNGRSSNTVTIAIQ